MHFFWQPAEGDAVVLAGSPARAAGAGLALFAFAMGTGSDRTLEIGDCLVVGETVLKRFDMINYSLEPLTQCHEGCELGACRPQFSFVT